MTRPLKITKDVHFQSMKRGRKELREGSEESMPTLGRIPRVSRLLALAIQMEDLCRRGEVVDFADLARLTMVTRARMTQIMGLLLLAPDIQEEILFLPRSEGGPADCRGAGLSEAAGDVAGAEGGAPAWREGLFLEIDSHIFDKFQ